jgi:undecaprenyl-diphosphatase
VSFPDSGLYRWMVHAADSSPAPVRVLIEQWSTLGIAVICALGLVAVLRARTAPSHLTARLLGLPVALVVAVVLGIVLKGAFREVRPCATQDVVRTLAACPPHEDWSFPSNHMMVASVLAVGIWLVDRQLGTIAVVAALGVGLARVGVGAHYPHDVAASAILGAAIAIGVATATSYCFPAVERLRATPTGRRLLGSGPLPAAA